MHFAALPPCKLCLEIRWEAGGRGGKGRGKKMTKQSCGLEEGGRASKKKIPGKSSLKGSSTSSSQTPFVRAVGVGSSQSLLILSPSPLFLPRYRQMRLRRRRRRFFPSRHETVGEFRGQVLCVVSLLRWGCWRRNCQEGVRLAY